jgi:hypothetical protein
MPQVQEYLKSRGMPEKAVRLLDSAPLHPNKNVLKANCKMYYGHFYLSCGETCRTLEELP